MPSPTSSHKIYGPEGTTLLTADWKPTLRELISLGDTAKSGHSEQFSHAQITTWVRSALRRQWKDLILSPMMGSWATIKEMEKIGGLESSLSQCKGSQSIVPAEDLKTLSTFSAQLASLSTLLDSRGEGRANGIEEEMADMFVRGELWLSGRGQAWESAAEAESRRDRCAKLAADIVGARTEAESQATRAMQRWTARCEAKDGVPQSRGSLLSHLRYLGRTVGIGAAVITAALMALQAWPDRTDGTADDQAEV